MFTNPENTTPPYYFAEETGVIEGAVYNIATLLEKFEPIDILNGKTRIYDSTGKGIILQADNEVIVENNEHPPEYKGITYVVSEATEANLGKVNEAKKDFSEQSYLD